MDLVIQEKKSEKTIGIQGAKVFVYVSLHTNLVKELIIQDMSRRLKSANISYYLGKITKQVPQLSSDQHLGT